MQFRETPFHNFRRCYWRIFEKTPGPIKYELQIISITMNSMFLYSWYLYDKSGLMPFYRMATGRRFWQWSAKLTDSDDIFCTNSSRGVPKTSIIRFNWWISTFAKVLFSNGINHLWQVTSWVVIWIFSLIQLLSNALWTKSIAFPDHGYIFKSSTGHYNSLWNIAGIFLKRETR